MKMNIIFNTKARIFALAVFLIICGINSTENHNRNHQEFKIRPNLNDINGHFQKVVKPFIETPFLPTEVDSLEEKKRPNYSQLSMTNAQLVGKIPDHKGKKEIERPIMYSTIFAAHPTVIKHPTPQPRGLGVNNDTAKAFALSDEASRLAEKMPKGSYSTPVRLESDANGGENSPTFVQSKERILKEQKENKNHENTTFKEPNQQKFLKDSFNKDVNLFMDNLENKKDKAERISTMIKGKKRLDADMDNIRKTIEGTMKELLFAKEVALKLTNLNNYYTTQIKRSKLGGLKLSEVITLKQLLRQKIAKEIQGIRTASADYADLDKINPTDIADAMKNIHLELLNKN